MRFTQETDYAFRVVQAIARAGPDGLLTAAEMAEKAEIPRRFLLHVLRKLKRGGIVASRQGVAGGYRLGRPAGDISLLDVAEAVEGEISINRCLRDTSLCNGRFASGCGIHHALAEVQEGLIAGLRRRTFANLSKKNRT